MVETDGRPEGPQPDAEELRELSGQLAEVLDALGGFQATKLKM